MDERSPTRREFSKGILGTMLSISLLETLFTGCSSPDGGMIPGTSGVIDSKASRVLNHWSIELNEISNDLKEKSIPQKIWQEQVERLLGKIELKELLAFIDFERLAKRFEFPDLGVNTKKVTFPEFEGLDESTVFIKKMFGVKKGRAIIPHGHSNMASAHLVLDGSFRLRHYSKLSDGKDHLIIEPSIDREITAGASSSISDERDNVHWFVATSQNAFTFDVIVLDLNGEKYDIHNLDMGAAEKLSGGRLRAGKMDVASALKKYGKTHHEA